MNKKQLYVQYIRERFPILGALLYGGGLFYSYYFYQAFIIGGHPHFLYSLPGSLVVFLSLFHLRLLDDIKDYESDKELYPDRMLSKGLIARKDLKHLLLLIVLVEIVFSVLYGWRQVYLWLAFFLWSMLMAKEFFLASWLKSRKGFYLASHQMIIPLLGFYAANTAGQISSIPFSLFIFSIVILSLTLTYELSRKSNLEDEESYPAVWGVKRTVVGMSAIAGTGAMLLLCLFYLAGVHWYFYLMVTGALSLFLFTELSFLINPSGRKAKVVKIGGALYMLTLFSLIIIAYT